MDNIKSPNKGERITAEWAKRITAAANRIYGAPPRMANGINIDVESPSAYAFKVSRRSDYKSFLVCLPPGCVSYGSEIIIVASDLTPATVKTYSSSSDGESETKDVAVDGRFNHVYPLELAAGELTAGEACTIFCALVNDASEGKKKIIFYVGSDNQDAAIGRCTLLAAFAVCNVTSIVETAATDKTPAKLSYQIEQVTRGAVHLGGTGGEEIEVVRVTSGDAQSGYTGTSMKSGSELSSLTFLAEVSLGSTLPENSVVLAHPITLAKTGGSES